MLAYGKVIFILFIGTMLGYWLACMMIDSSEQSRIEEKLLKEETSSNREYEEY